LTTLPPIIDRPSPNFGERPADATLDMLIIHYTGMESTEASLARLCDPAARVSAHYLIDEDGTLYRLVDEASRAWHAGASHWAGATDINSRSLGIELQNPGHEFGYRSFPEAQMAVLIDLCGEILARHGIPAARVLGHSDVAPSRKEDPGELFDWKRLADAGVGRLPAAPVAAAGMDEHAARASLTAIGYDPGVSLGDVLTAFQRHYRQTKIDGLLDPETAGLIRALAGG
jgi:N-acetylmuramoyl-L-alanine amidase